MAFHYYGRKLKIGSRYPAAVFPTIVEPFAGSAAYACRAEHRGRTVILVEKDPVIVAIWRRLLAMTDDDIRNLQPITPGEVTNDPLHIVLTASRRWWTYKKITVTPFMAANWNVLRRQWVSLLPELHHWTVIEGSYTDAPDIEATWFVDPPYPAQGDGYRFGPKLIDYASLASWCRSRRGQVIVCGDVTDQWLPFRPLAEVVGIAGKRSREGIWTQ